MLDVVCGALIKDGQVIGDADGYYSVYAENLAGQDTTDVAKGEPRCQAAIRIGDVNYWSIRRNEPGEMHHVTVRDVASAGRVAVWIKGPLNDSSVTGIRCLAGGKKYDVTAPIARVDLDPQ